MITSLVPTDTVDARGLQRRVLVTADGSSPTSEGIPISLDVSALYPHMPLAFVVALTDALWAVGLIEPKDYLAAGAAEKARAALLSVVKRDALDLISYAKEQGTL